MSAFMHETARALPIEAEALELTVTTSGGNTVDRNGSGWLAAYIGLHGPRGSLLAGASLHPAQLRRLASMLTAAADVVELAPDRTCACHNGAHLFPTRDELAAEDRAIGGALVERRPPRCPAPPVGGLAYCAACWTEETGSAGATHQPALAGAIVEGGNR